MAAPAGSGSQSVYINIVMAQPAVDDQGTPFFENPDNDFPVIGAKPKLKPVQLKPTPSLGDQNVAADKVEMLRVFFPHRKHKETNLCHITLLFDDAVALKPGPVLAAAARPGDRAVVRQVHLTVGTFARGDNSNTNIDFYNHVNMHVCSLSDVSYTDDVYFRVGDALEVIKKDPGTGPGVGQIVALMHNYGNWGVRRSEDTV